MQQALEPLLRPVTIVEAEGNAPSAMRLLAEASDQPLGIRLAAWNKEGKEVTSQTLEDDLRVARRSWRWRSRRGWRRGAWPR